MKFKISLNSDKKKIARIRKLTWELFALNQIPSRLCFAICESDSLKDKTDITFFTEITKELLRVRGFYKDPQRNSQMNAEFTRLYDEYKEKRKGV